MTAAWPSSSPRWRSTGCSSPYADASRPLLIAASTAASITPPRPWKPSAPPCARKWTWTSCASSCWPWCTRLYSQLLSHCGCALQNQPGNGKCGCWQEAMSKREENHDGKQAGSLILFNKLIRVISSQSEEGPENQ